MKLAKISDSKLVWRSLCDDAYLCVINNGGSVGAKNKRTGSCWQSAGWCRADLTCRQLFIIKRWMPSCNLKTTIFLQFLGCIHIAGSYTAAKWPSNGLKENNRVIRNRQKMFQDYQWTPKAKTVFKCDLIIAGDVRAACFSSEKSNTNLKSFRHSDVVADWF